MAHRAFEPLIKDSNCATNLISGRYNTIKKQGIKFT